MISELTKKELKKNQNLQRLQKMGVQLESLIGAKVRIKPFRKLPLEGVLGHEDIGYFIRNANGITRFDLRSVATASYLGTVSEPTEPNQST